MREKVDGWVIDATCPLAQETIQLDGKTKPEGKLKYLYERFLGMGEWEVIRVHAKLSGKWKLFMQWLVRLLINTRSRLDRAK